MSLGAHVLAFLWVLDLDMEGWVTVYAHPPVSTHASTSSTKAVLRSWLPTWQESPHSFASSPALGLVTWAEFPPFYWVCYCSLNLYFLNFKFIIFSYTYWAFEYSNLPFFFKVKFT